MHNDRWETIQRLFEAALELKPDQIDEFLARECRGDADLEREVRSLLDADAREGGLLDIQAEDLLPAAEPAFRPNTVIGEYRIIKQLGTGGMGTVYLAERADDDFHQNVALKIVRRGMNSEEILRRFRMERQILAGLNHPNIARLFDGGMTESGIPYFTLEYIDGENIDVYCDKYYLTVRERLEKFLTVCDAVEYAQRNLIVHRDLKPGNIQVTDDGTVKLLDFGIAKLLDADGGFDIQADMTRTGVRLLTPRYASPEQILAKPVTTASDVYALGVILYELLTGSQPYAITKNQSAREVEDVICTTEPQKPSISIGRIIGEDGSIFSQEATEKTAEKRRTTPAKLKRQLTGDIDTICLTALKKEPERRYQSAGEMARDIRLHLEGRPITARPDSLAYRTRKFIGRYRFPMAAALVLILTVTTLTVYYTINLARERDRARIEAQKAQQVADFMIELFQSADPNNSKGDEITARELLESGAARIEQDLAGEPEIQATLMKTIGSVYQQLGQYEKAEPFYNKCLALQIQAYGEKHPEVAATYSDIGVLMYDLGDLDSSETLYRKAYEIDTMIFGNNDTIVATDLNNIATALRANGEDDEAEKLLRSCLAVRLHIFGEDHLDVAHTMNHLGRLVAQKGNTEEGEDFLRRGLIIRRKLLGNENYEVTASLGALAGLLRSKGDHEGAIEAYEEALAIMTKLTGREHSYVGGLMSSLANAYNDLEKYDTALALFTDAKDILTKSLPASHPNQAYVYVGMGLSLTYLNRFDEAEEALRRGVETRRKGLPEGHWMTGVAESCLGLCLMKEHKFEEAETSLVAGYTLLYNHFGIDNRITQKALQRIVELYELWGKEDKAAEYAALLN
ncbi:MAG: serine/threonine-protein kinase [Candidatus Zixiibacteriota bacterium]